MTITDIINFILIIIITTPINTLMQINIFQMVNLKNIAIIMIKVFGHIVRIIILIIYNYQYGHNTIYVMFVSLAINTIIINIIMLNFDWTQWRLGYWTTMPGIIWNLFKLFQPKSSHSWPVPSLFAFLLLVFYFIFYVCSDSFSSFFMSSLFCLFSSSSYVSMLIYFANYFQMSMLNVHINCIRWPGYMIYFLHVKFPC